MDICRFVPDVTSKERVKDVYLGLVSASLSRLMELAQHQAMRGWRVKHKNSMGVLSQIIKNEGINLLFKSDNANIVRAIVLPGYDKLKSPS
ncbi:hypothetical protein Tco_1231915, partial [Tanacetum coccineum]